MKTIFLSILLFQFVLLMPFTSLKAFEQRIVEQLAAREPEPGNAFRIIISSDFPPIGVVKGGDNVPDTQKSDPDDMQSMVRFLLYANEFDIEGLVASAGTFAMVADKNNILGVLNEYEKVYDNLKTYDPDYPTADYLRSVTYEGRGNNHGLSITWGCGKQDYSEIIGKGLDSEASNAIIASADKPDPRPIYICVWGGPREVAQAIWDIKNTRSEEELKTFIGKLRIFLIACQDATHEWLMNEFPDLFIIESRRTYQGMFRSDSIEWVETNIINNHGPLGAIYPSKAMAGPGVIEGDSPSFLYLVSANRGINDPEDPTQPSWGGQYVRVGSTNHYVDGAGGSTISKWKNDFQAEFRERADWMLKSQPNQKSRVFVLTDIENEPDDAQSLVRFMTYSNHWDVEGFVATTSCWQRNKTAEWRIHEIVDAYGKVRDNLEKHEPGYPTHEYMKKVIKKGVPKFGMEGVGEGNDSEGSEWLIKCLEKDDPRPVYIQAWGGANVLAQALWKMERTKSKSELSKIISKIRVYTISDQDDTGPWIRKRFPDIFYVVSPGYEENGGGQYHYATWSGISGDRFHGRFDGPDFSIVDNPWLDEHIRNNHGPLGAGHPHTEYLMEGDTPSFLGLVKNGLNDPEHPDYGGWGGRYELYIPPFKKYMYEPETRPIWTDTQDEVWSDITQRYHTSNHATIWRWREAYQHDFAARIDWSNTPDYTKANHPPDARLGHSNEINVKSGEAVTLSAKGSSDPDNDRIKFNWIHYREVGTMNAYGLELENQDKMDITFVAPKTDVVKTMHFILEVTDNGEPSLTRYQRVIVNVIP